MPGKLILVRHGQSTWNLENLFTGWHDVDLSELGREEAVLAGRELLREKIEPHIAFTSVLKRAIRTLWLMLDTTDRMWIPVERSWRLNERHYGALQGLNKAQTVAQHGEAQVKIWRRSYDVPPPALAMDDPRHPRFDPRYADLDPEVAAASGIAQGHAGPGSSRSGKRGSFRSFEPTRTYSWSRTAIRCGRWSKCSTACPKATSSNSTSQPAFRCSTNWTSRSQPLEPPISRRSRRDRRGAGGGASSNREKMTRLLGVRRDRDFDAAERLGEFDLARQPGRAFAENRSVP